MCTWHRERQWSSILPTTSFLQRDVKTAALACCAREGTFRDLLDLWRTHQVPRDRGFLQSHRMELRRIRDI